MFPLLALLIQHLPPPKITKCDYSAKRPHLRWAGLLFLVVALGWASSAAAQPACSINPIISPLSYNPAFNRGGTSHAEIFSITEYSGDGNRLLLVMNRSATHPDHVDLTGENPDGSSELYLYDIPTETYTQITDSFGADFLDGVRVSGVRSVLSENGDRVVFASNGNLTGANPEGDDHLFLYDYPTDTLTQISPADESSGEDLTYLSLSPNENRVLFHRSYSSSPNSAAYLYDIPTDSMVLRLPFGRQEGGENFDVIGLMDDRTLWIAESVFFGGKFWAYNIATGSLRELYDLSAYAGPTLTHVHHNGKLTLLITGDEIYTRDSDTDTLTQVTQDGVFPTIVRPPGVPLTNIPSKDSPPFYSRQMAIDGHMLIVNPSSPRYFFLSRYPERASQEIFLFDAGTATLTQLTDSRLAPLAGKTLDFAYVSPDGNTLIFTGGYKGTDRKPRTDTFRYDVPTQTLTTLFSRGSAPLGNRAGGPRRVLSPDTMFLDVGIPLGQGRDQHGFELEREDFLYSLYRATCSATGSVTHPPAAPAAPQVRAGNGQLTVTWNTPANNGSALEDYTVQWKESSFSEWFWEGLDVGRADLRAGGATTYTITGLDNDTAYQVRVRATNAGGNGDWSAAASGTPAAVVDQTPSFGVGTYNATLTVGTPVNLTLPAATGGDGALRYSLSPLPAGLSFNSQTRVLSGTPTTAQNATAATYTVTDSDATDPDSAMRSFTLTILDPTGTQPGSGTLLSLPASEFARLEANGMHAFRFEVPRPGILRLETSGQTDTVGTLWREHVGVATDDNSGSGSNFRIVQAVPAGTYRLTVQGGAGASGDYTLVAALNPGTFENPPAGSTQSGISVVYGWVCEADVVEIVFENGTTGAVTTVEAAYGTERGDTQTACGDTDNAFNLLFNWNLLGGGQHQVQVLVDGVELARRTVSVPELGAEVLQGRDERYTLSDFPTVGEAVDIQWSPAQQGFVLVSGSGGGQGAQHTPSEATLDSPRPGSFQSGIGLVYGWVCEADVVEIVFENGTTGAVTTVEAAYGTERGDTQTACGDTDNAFNLLFNWNLLGGGQHTIRALADGVEFAWSTFTVTTLGTGYGEFVEGLQGTYTLADFPAVGSRTVVEWQQARQNFTITRVTDP